MIGNLIKRPFAGDRAGSSAAARHPRPIGAADQLADCAHDSTVGRLAFAHLGRTATLIHPVDRVNRSSGKPQSLRERTPGHPSPHARHRDHRHRTATGGGFSPFGSGAGWTAAVDRCGGCAAR